MAPGLALAAGAGLCAAIGGTLEQTAVLSIALAAAITASGPTLAYAALAVALGSLAMSFWTEKAYQIRRFMTWLLWWDLYSRIPKVSFSTWIRIVN